MKDETARRPRKWLRYVANHAASYDSETPKIKYNNYKVKSYIKISIAMRVVYLPGINKQTQICLITISDQSARRKHRMTSGLCSTEAPSQYEGYLPLISFVLAPLRTDWTRDWRSNWKQRPSPLITPTSLSNSTVSWLTEFAAVDRTVCVRARACGGGL